MSKPTSLQTVGSIEARACRMRRSQETFRRNVIGVPWFATDMRCHLAADPGKLRQHISSPAISVERFRALLRA